MPLSRTLSYYLFLHPMRVERKKGQNYDVVVIVVVVVVIVVDIIVNIVVIII